MTRALAAALLAVLAAACGPGAGGPEPPDRAPEFSGAVVATDDGGRVLVRPPEDACGIWAAPGEDVTVLRRTPDGFAEAAWEDVRPGLRADLWVPGPVAESCPLQGSAEAVVLADDRP